MGGAAQGQRLTSADLPQLLSLLDHLPGMVAYWDENLRNHIANTAYVEWFGIGPEEMRGMHIRDLLGPEVYERNLPYIRAVLAGEPQLFNRTLIDVHGRTRYTQASYIPRLVDGEPHGFFVLVTDITERVLAEGALAASVADVALLRERQRIAADLHDLVIQSLYAAALALSRLSRELTPQQAAEANAVIDRIDDAVINLRASIQGMTRSLGAPQFIADLTQVVENAAITLGFAPRMITEGPADLIPPEARPDILAVTQEALTNIAKHAAATQVTVSLTMNGPEVHLVIADNGIGLRDGGRHSGLGNIRARAQRLHGDAAFIANEPSGTIVDWRIASTQQPPAPVVRQGEARARPR